jgi:preprotein translocase subunit YajC
MLINFVRTVARRSRLLVMALVTAPLVTACTTAAQDGGEGTETSGSAALVQILIFAVAIGGLMYFMMIRPQRNRARKQQELVSSLDVGDEVQTIGGIFGTIEYMDDDTDTVVLQIEGGGRIRMARKALAGKVDRGVE